MTQPECVTPVQDNTFLFQFIAALSHVMLHSVRFLISETIKNLNKPFCAHMTHTHNLFNAKLTWTVSPSLRAGVRTWRTLSCPRTPGSSCLTWPRPRPPPPHSRSACCTAGRCPAPASGNWPREPGRGEAPPGDPCLYPASPDTPATHIINLGQ